MKKNKSGFTLIELLVVIAIIGLLSTLSILALNQARARARDAKRISDVRQIQTALELHYNDTGDYPASGAVDAGDSIGNYLVTVPTPPTVIDGTICTTAPNYTYVRTGGTAQSGTASYSIAYCLGQTVNDITGNTIHYATPAGMTN